VTYLEKGAMEMEMDAQFHEKFNRFSHTRGSVGWVACLIRPPFLYSSSSNEVHPSVSLNIIELVICTFTDKEACD
jgi:hypothetical protein